MTLIQSSVTRAHHLQTLLPMREQEAQKPKPGETPNESVDKEKPEAKKRACDTLSEENPLICRGMD